MCTGRLLRKRDKWEMEKNGFVLCITRKHKTQLVKQNAAVVYMVPTTNSILPLIFAWLHNLNSLSDIIFLLVNKVAKKKFGSGLAENPNYKEKRYTSVTKLSTFYSKRWTSSNLKTKKKIIKQMDGQFIWNNFFREISQQKHRNYSCFLDL